MQKQRVLFLCTGNSCRSQMAEAFLRKHGSDLFEVYSAGIEPKPINPLTYRVMAEIGLDLAGHSSKRLAELTDKLKFDYLITVCDEADKNCPSGLVKSDQRLHWFFEDPAAFAGSDEERPAKFRQVRDLIEKRIIAWVKQFRA